MINSLSTLGHDEFEAQLNPDDFDPVTDDVEITVAEFDKPDVTVGRLAGAGWQSLKAGVGDIVSSVRFEAEQDHTKEMEEDLRLVEHRMSHMERLEAADHRTEMEAQGVTALEAQRQSFRKVLEKRNEEAFEVTRRLRKVESKLALDPDYQRSSGYVEDVIKGAARSAPAIAAGLVSSYASVPLMFNQMRGAAIQKLESLGVDRETTAKAANFSASVQTPLEAVGNLFQIRAILGGSGFKRIATNSLQAAIGEYATEWLQQFPEEAAMFWAVNKDLPPDQFVDKFKAKLPQIVKDANYAGLVGFGAGGSMAAGGASLASTIETLTTPGQRVAETEKKERLHTLADKVTEKKATDQEIEELRERMGAPDDADPQKIAEDVLNRYLFQSANKLVSPARDEIRKSLSQGGKFTNEQADAYLSMWDSIARRVAEVEGRTPDAFYEDFLTAVQHGHSEEFLAKARDFNMQAIAPTFYSKLEQSVSGDKAPGKGTGKAWLQTIKAWTKKGEIKSEELEWSGLLDWLPKQKGKVTKQEVVDYLQQNHVRVEEVVRVQEGMGHPDLPYDEAEEMGHYSDPRGRTGTIYQEHTLPGGRNYKEVLLTLPDKELLTNEESAELKDLQQQRDILGFENDEQEARHAELEQKYLKSRDKGFIGSHWRERNVVAHMRFSDRTVSGDKKALHAEEIQSDWHQKGRKAGYGERERYKAHTYKPEDFEITEAELQWVTKDAEGVTRTVGKGVASTELEARDYFARWLTQLSKEYEQEQNLRASDKVPDAPFKKSWQMLAAKRLVRHAAEQGYDYIMWTGGKEQAARYDLSQHVDKVAYQENGDGKYRLNAQTRDRGGMMLGERLSIEQVAEHVGKDLADKISVGAGAQENWAGNNEPTDYWKTFAGGDLQVGGEGMVGFYDKILPAEMKKFFGKKAWGKAKPVKKTVQFPDSEGGKKDIEVWVMPITDAMRGKALYEGMPLFQGGNKSLKAPPNGLIINHGNQSEQIQEPPIQLEFEFKAFKDASRPQGQDKKAGGLQANQRSRMSTTGRIATDGNIVRHSGDVAGLLASIRKSAQELIYSVAVDENGTVLEIHRYSKGTSASSQVNPIELVGRAMNIEGARKLYFVHNHPSLSTSPSAEDLGMAKRISETAGLRSMPVINLIISGTKFQAFDQQGPIGGGPIQIEPRLRKTYLPQKERGLRGAQEVSQAQPFRMPDQVRRYVQETYPDQEGTLFVNTANKPVGFLPFKSGAPRKEWSADIIAAAEATNARAVFFYSKKPLFDGGSPGPRFEYFSNLGKWLGNTLEALDVVDPNSSALESETTHHPGRVPYEIVSSEAALYQGDISKPRGAIERMGDTTQHIIHLFENADPTTVVHETGHLILDMMWRTKSPDYQAAARFAGVDTRRSELGLEAWTPDEQETIARAFEAYVMEGKAPTMRLAGVFRRMKAWMLGVYRSIKALNVELTDEIRRVFDGWVSSDLERESDPVYETLDWYSVDDIHQHEQDPDIYSDYESIANTAAKRAIEKKRADWAKHEKLVKARLKIEATQLVDENPVFEMMAEIKRNGGLKLSNLHDLYDSEFVQDMQQKSPGLISRDGIDADVMATEWGYYDTDEMLQAIVNTSTKKAAIESIYNDLLVEWEHTREFEMADTYEDAIHQEIEIMNGLLGKKKHVIRDLKKTIRKQTGQVKDQEYRNLKDQMKRLQNDTRKAWNAGTKEGKQKAMRLKMEYAQKVARLKHRHKTVQNRAFVTDYISKALKSKTIEEPYRNQIGAIARVHGFFVPQRIGQPDKSLEELTKQIYAENGDHIGQFFEDTLQHYGRVVPRDAQRGELDLEQIEALNNLVQMLATVGRQVNKTLTIQKQQHIDKVVGGMVGAMIDQYGMPTDRTPWDVISENTGLAARAKDFTAQTRAELEKAEFLFRAADGWKDFGPNQQVFEAFYHAQNAEMKLGAKLFDELNREFANMGGKAWSQKRYAFPHIGALASMQKGIQHSLTKEQMIMIALNSGNEGNMAALKHGMGLQEDDVQDIVNQLSPEEWHLVERVWAIVDQLYAPLNEVHKTLTGITLPKVEGKYFPLVFDAKSSWHAGFLADKQAEKTAFDESPYLRRNVEAGHRMTRTGGKMPVLLEFRVIRDHILKTVHDITHQLPVRDAQRIINHRDYRKTFVHAMGEQRYKQLQPWLNHLAKPERSPQLGIERFMGHVMRNTTVVALGAKLSVSLAQIGSIFQTVSELGQGDNAKHQPLGMSSLGVLKAQAALYSDYSGTIAFVHGKSIEVATRGKNFDRELRAMYDEFDPGASPNADRVKDALFMGIQFMDRQATIPTWLAAYNTGLKKFEGDDAKAVSFADGVVRRTQPASNPKDLAAIQRGGGLKKMFTMFYTFFSVFHNQVVETNRRFAGGNITIGQAMRAYGWMVIVAPLASDALRKMDVPDDPKELGLSIASYWLARLPLVRDMIGPIFSGYSYSMSPVERTLEAPSRIYKTATGNSKEKEKQLWKLTLSAIGYTTGMIPADQINTIIDGTDKWLDGKQESGIRTVVKGYRDDRRKRKYTP